jgi:hypothetical protein
MKESVTSVEASKLMGLESETKEVMVDNKAV